MARKTIAEKTRAFEKTSETKQERMEKNRKLWKNASCEQIGIKVAEANDWTQRLKKIRKAANKTSNFQKFGISVPVNASKPRRNLLKEL